ncbi:MAG: DUF5652 family protein [Candidatus Margulisiibacteriota bacterium]|jgi:methionyl-tRNA synthetase
MQEAVTQSPYFNFVIILIAFIWSLIWKGIALWRSARNEQPVWFTFLLIINSLGILEIIYLLFFQKEKNITAFKVLGAFMVIIAILVLVGMYFNNQILWTTINLIEILIGLAGGIALLAAKE